MIRTYRDASLSFVKLRRASWVVSLGIYTHYFANIREIIAQMPLTKAAFFAILVCQLFSVQRPTPATSRQTQGAFDAKAFIRFRGLVLSPSRW